jgi:hypothetical protein
MKLSLFEQLDFAESSKSYDLIVTASGYESRARFVAETIGAQGSSGCARLVLSFAEHLKECARPENDAAFERLGYKPFLCHGRSDEEVSQVIAGALEALPKIPEPRILVDISSMTRAWYGAIVRSVMALHLEGSMVVHFAYTPAEFVAPPNDYPPNRIVGPVAGFTGNTLPTKPTALILGLGYDKDRAIGLKDHLDPQLTILFYADPASDDRYVPHVLSVNSGLFHEVRDECIFPYPFMDASGAFRLLESVSKGMTRDWRVVLCSLGPKVFGLYCFLVASLNRDISIWRVTADLHEEPFDHKASGVPILLQTKWD